MIDPDDVTRIERLILTEFPERPLKELGPLICDLCQDLREHRASHPDQDWFRSARARLRRVERVRERIEELV